jgi:UDP-2,4-diacetamido-2,4,6-trideoxy-beta-L-altropyranose hydrolase
MTRVAVRVDASGRMGTGHVMRCLTLAGALRAQGAEVRFICRAHPGHLADRIEAAGFPVALLPAPPTPTAPIADADYTAWLGVPSATDAAETIAALDGGRPDWLVVDHYALGADWEQALRPHVGAILAVDDLADRPHACDVLLDQTFHPEAEARYAGLVPPGCRLLCGPRFALLRPEYAAMRHLLGGPRPAGPVARVLVYFGGVDATNETARALRVLSEPAFAPLAVDVVVPASGPHRAEVEAMAATRPGTVLYGPRPHLADLMARADLALGAGGATSWERGCLGLPALVTVLADNQAALSAALADAGAVRVIGHAPSIADGHLRAALADVSDDAAGRAAMSRAAWDLGDGEGLRRAVETIRPGDPDGLRVRAARPGDAAPLFAWLNDPETRRQSFQSDPVPWADHVAWLDATLAAPDRVLRIVETAEGLAVGQVRFDRIEGAGLISYGLDPLVRGRGWGSRVLGLAVADWARHGGGAPLHGFVRPDNRASIRSFERAGFSVATRPHPLAPPGAVDMVWTHTGSETESPPALSTGASA